MIKDLLGHFLECRQKLAEWGIQLRIVVSLMSVIAFGMVRRSRTIVDIPVVGEILTKRISHPLFSVNNGSSFRPISQVLTQLFRLTGNRRRLVPTSRMYQLPSLPQHPEESCFEPLHMRDSLRRSEPCTARPVVERFAAPRRCHCVRLEDQRLGPKWRSYLCLKTVEYLGVNALFHVKHAH